jgi:hypothetical protein
MPGRKSDTELDDLNLHVKSPLANDLASRFGDLAHPIVGYQRPATYLSRHC